MSHLTESCQTIYRETKEFYAQIAEDCGNLGFKILYGPPLLNPPILFIGYQPGGGAESYEEELKSGAHDGWPQVCEYATENWKLAKTLQRMFGVELLEKCVGLNAIFIRSPSVNVYNATLTPSLRIQINRFCLSRVDEMIKLMEPQRIVLIGFETLNLFGGGIVSLQNEKGRTLIKTGKVADREVMATLHLTGAQISSVDQSRIRDIILER